MKPMPMPRPAPRPLLAIVRGQPTTDGDGVRLTRILGTREAQMFDPFLLLDYFDHAEGRSGGGFPDHPHRGFETVTYMLDGRMRHADNKGHAGLIGPGGVQWMRAGSGLVHSEMPEAENGRMRGFQLWVNLPGRLKMIAPAYQEFTADHMGRETRPGAEIRVVAGTTAAGARGPVRNEAIAPVYFDVRLDPGATFVEPLAPAHSAFVAVFEGAAAIEGKQVDSISAAFLGKGEAAEIHNPGPGPLRFLLIAGAPIGEPVAWAGPFVMNTRAEIDTAFADYRAGRL